MQTSFAPLTGQLPGITCFAGTLFKEANSGNLLRRTLPFVLFGADFRVMVISRLVMACIAATLLSRSLSIHEKKKKTKESEPV